VTAYGDKEKCRLEAELAKAKTELEKAKAELDKRAAELKDREVAQTEARASLDKATSLLNEAKSVLKNPLAALTNAIAVPRADLEQREAELIAKEKAVNAKEKELNDKEKNDQMTKYEGAFYNDVAEATEKKRFVSFADYVPSIQLKKLFIRDSYETIASEMLKVKGKKKIVITGTPGIGKSCFLFYLLWRLVKKKEQRVLFVFNPDMIYYDGKEGIFYVSHLPSAKDRKFWNDDLWCLFDSNGRHDLVGFPYDACRFVLSMSPKRELINDFKKKTRPQFYFMPIWEEAELRKIARHYPEFPNWLDDFKLVGGIPRELFEIKGVTTAESLEIACSQCDLDKCINQVKMKVVATEKFEASHLLVHIKSSPPYTDAFVDFATSATLRKVYDVTDDNHMRKMFSLLESIKGRPVVASVYGRIFEEYALIQLEKGGEFKTRMLHDGYSGIEKPLTLKKSTIIWEMEVGKGMKTDQLYQPNSKTYPNIDAWMPETGVFQITVSSTHAITDQARLIKDLAKLRTGEFFWVIPSSLYDSDEFKKKYPKDINQYVLRVPSPSEVEMSEREKFESALTRTEAARYKVVHPREDDNSLVETERVKKKRK
jgi:DNA replication protein DnaC